MFLVRSAFWLSLVIFLLPGDPATGKPPPAAGTVAMLLSVRSAISDVAGLCNDQPDLCRNGFAILSAVGSKARDGMTLFDQAIEAGRSSGVIGAPAEGIAGPTGRDTLKPADLRPNWQTPAASGPA